MRVHHAFLALFAICLIALPLDAVAQDGTADLESTVTKLPSTADGQVALGGDGRYLVLHFKKLRRLGIYDFEEKKITGYISATDENVLFAANSKHLFVYLGASGVISRYDLESREREATVAFSKDVAAIAAGYSSDGPLVVVTANRYDGIAQLYNTRTLKPIDNVSTSGRSGRPEGQFECGRIVNVSANGQVYGGYRTGVSPSGVYVTTYNGSSIVALYDHASQGVIRPGPRGERIYTSTSVISSDLQPIVKQTDGLWIPELTGGQFVLRLKQPQRDQAAQLSLHVWNNDQALIHLDLKQLGFAEFPSHPVHFGQAAWHQRLFYNAKLNTLVTLPDGMQSIVAAKLDIEKVLEKSGLDYLFVLSQPPTDIEQGTTMKYTPKVMSKRGGVKMSLQAGPEGMALNEKTGELTWDVPNQTVEESVIILVSDKTGQEVFHTFMVKSSSANNDEPAEQEPGGVPKAPR